MRKYTIVNCWDMHELLFFYSIFIFGLLIFVYL